MTNRHRSYFVFSLILIGACGIVGIVIYGLLPLMRGGLPSFPGDQVMVQTVKASGRGLAVSDLIIAFDRDHIQVAPLSPQLARQLASEKVEITPLRDLPGFFPIVFCFAVAVVSLFSMRRGDRHQQLKTLVLFAIVAAAATQFYLWLWTVAADHDLSTPLAGAQQIKSRGLGLSLWFKSLAIQTPLWIIAMLILVKYLRENLQRDFITLVVACFYSLLTVSSLLLFRPDPYSRFLVLSWWPLLFSLAVLSCGFVSMFVLRQIHLRPN